MDRERSLLYQICVSDAAPGQHVPSRCQAHMEELGSSEGEVLHLAGHQRADLDSGLPTSAWP
jgi:hypothetical protein